MSTNAFTVNVSGISPVTTEQHLHDFFTFCGTIRKIDFNAEKQTAAIHFEKPSAAKTALMLNEGTLDGAHLAITSDQPDVVHKEDTSASREHIEQSDKPRAGIAAEYLAKGYTLSDQILQRAIELDQQHGISNRFLSYIQTLDTTVGAKALGPEKTISGKVQETLASATQQAKAADEQRGISKTAVDYYSRAFASPFGQKVKAFYTTTSKQVLDIHEEARRIHETHKASAHAAPGAPASAAASAPPADAPKTTEAPTVA
ncbi:uncharacterized protein BXZ73DRAFT_101251 [Epithele typhae]|uniref:uncharacterized protein n=1 Tax=Epithele typhae TaxID=378194 RepID=UPI002007ECEB|nr:uncharacterized protein BXZ73DRAFT_101251 [Epithele typhae]KAH9932710.1 hypothetical protein BXZ73DRAFT_101251 [Epithele typhae]